MNYYEENAKEYIDRTINADLSSERDELIKLLPNNAKILDIGFGSGRDSLAFIKEGFAVLSIDNCKEFCKHGEELGLNVKNISIENIDYDNEFDGIWACASLLHIKSNELLSVFKKIHKAMKYKGIFYCSFKHGEFEGIRENRYYTDMTLKKMEEILSKTELYLIKHWIREDFEGRDLKWICFIIGK
ncbi:MAG: class I SAM-dependent methyltransferase [bacterium]|nr:class I SAM-dependent methyltransferase [bacterium]